MKTLLACVFGAALLVTAVPTRAAATAEPVVVHAQYAGGLPIIRRGDGGPAYRGGRYERRRHYDRRYDRRHGSYRRYYRR